MTLNLEQFGPVKFSIEGTFTDKPRLLMNGEEVAYDSLFIMHNPAQEFDDGFKVEASTTLEFSVATSVGQLEARVMYRVKANEEDGLVLVKSDKHPIKEDKKGKKGKKPDFLNKKKDKKEDESEVGKADVHPIKKDKKDDKDAGDKAKDKKENKFKKVEKKEAAKDDKSKDDKSKDDKGKDGKKKFDFKGLKKGKSEIQAAPGSEIYIQNWRADLAEKIADAQ